MNNLHNKLNRLKTSSALFTALTILTLILIGCALPPNEEVDYRTDLNSINLSFAYNDIRVATNTPITHSPVSSLPLQITVTYSIAPDPPPGLTFNTNTAILSGTPTNAMTNNYSVTVTGVQSYKGSNTANFTMIVYDPVYISGYMLRYTNNIGVSYDSSSNEIYTINISDTPSPTITNLFPEWDNIPGDLTYTVDPTLPSWLTLNTNNGVISSPTPPTNAYYRRHIITATGNDIYVGTVTSPPVTIAIAMDVSNSNFKFVVDSLHNLQSPDVAHSLISNVNLNLLDTSLVTDMNTLFQNRGQDLNISRWDVGNVTSMRNMFNGYKSYVTDISKWDVGKVTNMAGMFADADNFNGNISSWNVSNVTDMNNMFSGNDGFNGNISNWNVSSVVNMSDMFASTTAFDGDISGWNVTNVTDMRRMFYSATAFSGTNLSLWTGRLGSVTTMEWMFRDASAFVENLDRWTPVTSVNTSGMFSGSGLTNWPVWCTNSVGVSRC